MLQEFYVWVTRTISHKWAQWARVILFLPQDHKIHFFELTCNVLFIILHCFGQNDDVNSVFDDFPNLDFSLLSEDFRKFSKTCPKVTRTLPNTIQKFLKIAEYFWGRSRDVSIVQQEIRDKLDISKIIYLH